MLDSSTHEIVPDDSADAISIATFPAVGHVMTSAQVCDFELFRLALFVLKLRKLESRHISGNDGLDESEFVLRRSMLRHVIFYQLVTLSALNAREQALRLISACRTHNDYGTAWS